MKSCHQRHHHENADHKISETGVVMGCMYNTQVDEANIITLMQQRKERWQIEEVSFRLNHIEMQLDT